MLIKSNTNNQPKKTKHMVLKSYNSINCLHNSTMLTTDRDRNSKHINIYIYISSIMGIKQEIGSKR